MIVSRDISMDYVKVQQGNTVSHGGSQLWFPKDGDFRDYAIHTGGCGLIAVYDLMLWYENRLQDAQKARLQDSEAGAGGDDRISGQEAYMAGIRRLSKTYPVLPKLGSSALFLPLYVNLYFLRKRAHLRLFYLFSGSPDKRMRILRGSLNDGYPVILMIGARVNPFGKMKGVPFYIEKNGRLMPALESIRRHYVTVTGIRFPEDISEPVMLEISSWGRKFLINYDELCTYMTKSSIPLLTGFFFLKSERGTDPFQA